MLLRFDVFTALALIVHIHPKTSNRTCFGCTPRKKCHASHSRFCCHGSAEAKGPPRQVSEMPSISEAVERAAVVNGCKKLIDRGPRPYERSPCELLPQTLSGEPLNCRRTAANRSSPRPSPTLPQGPCPLRDHYGRFCTVPRPSVRGMERNGHLQLACVSEDNDAAQRRGRAPPRAHRTPPARTACEASHSTPFARAASSTWCPAPDI